MKLSEAKRDYYRRLAKEKGYRSRAAFKLIQINKKYRFIRPNHYVIDLGAAPGGWLEVISELVSSKGKIIGVDITPIEPVAENVEIIVKFTYPADANASDVGNLVDALHYGYGTEV